ncbi:Crp/Fnr family transcriptional regulator [Listeria booriae]|uniref:Crp/Fnr family transcriptional regulator n=1 Tax=Listeria booriae TaxID=1552123 RepID=A0A7X1A4G2_9LIST|nr:Crp/Fnr family transcriptional regulator [Listeria booriae]MBC2371055.1 Crp/Fnr family transcriptional regulator [Listeria booriae]
MEQILELYGRDTLEDKFNDSNLFRQLSSLTPKKMEIKKRDVLTSSSDYIYYIVNGTLAQKKLGVPLAVIGGGSFIGLNSFLFQKNDVEKYEVLEAGTVLAFNKKDTLFLLLSLQEGWLYLLFREKKQNEILVENQLLLYKSGQDRVKETLCQLAEKFGTPVQEGWIIPRCFNKKFLADYTNMTLNSIKRITEIYIAKGWLTIEKYHFIIKTKGGDGPWEL